MHSNRSDIVVRIDRAVFRRVIFGTALVVGIGLPIWLVAAPTWPLVKKHTFSSGDPILASEVNENFDDLFEAVNDLNLRQGTNSTAPVDLYVDAGLGDDANSGLLPSAPKKTIQSAIDSIPLSVSSNLSIRIEPGTYVERVSLMERLLQPGASISLVGNAPGVVIKGDPSWTGGLEVHGIRTFVLDGITIRDTHGTYALSLRRSGGTIRSCTIGPSLDRGVLANRGRYSFENTTIDGNTQGLVCTSGAYCMLAGVTVTGNSWGFYALRGSEVGFSNGLVSGNGLGASAINSVVELAPGVTVTGNSQDLDARDMGLMKPNGATVGSCVADVTSVCL